MQWYPLLIAMILIAAAGTAACTGEESGPAPEAVSPALPGQQVVAVGDMTGNGTRGGTIDAVTFNIGLAPGFTSVDAENIRVIYADAVRTETLVPVPGLRGTPAEGSWGVVRVIGEEGIANNRIEFDELFRISVNPRAPIVPRQFITVVLQPPSGPPLTLRRIAPASILAENVFSLP